MGIGFNGILLFLREKEVEKSCRNTWKTFLFFRTEAKGAISVKGVYLHQVNGKTGSCRCQEPAFLFNWLAHTFFVFVYLVASSDNTDSFLGLLGEISCRILVGGEKD